MTAPAAFSATYSDWKLIKSRSVVQVVFEVPLEQADKAYSALGGMPSQGESVWCGIARLKQDAGARAPDRGPDVDLGKPDDAGPRPAPKRSWGELSPAQQAGIRCGEPAFWKYLGVDTPESAAQKVRTMCIVPSRSDIKAGTAAGQRWAELDQDYQVWMREPEVVG